MHLSEANKQRLLDYFEAGGTPNGLAELIATTPELTRAMLNPSGGQVGDIENTIRGYEFALKIYTKDTYPRDWASTHHNIAKSYLDRAQGTRTDNLENAIENLELALEVFTEKTFPHEWALAQNSLGNAYKDRIKENLSENIEKAINAYNLALRVRKRDTAPDDWAMTKHNLAVAYIARIEGDREQNVELAIESYELALEIRTKEDTPENWAMTQHSLANAYQHRTKEDREQNIEQAIKKYELVLQIRTKEAFPQDWAATQNSLANAYKDRIAGKRQQNIEKAINICIAALEARTLESAPEGWAALQVTLASAYKHRTKGDSAQNFEECIGAYKRALQVYSRQNFPEKWAMTQHNIATAYSEYRGECNRSQNIGEAIKAYNLALEIYSGQYLPKPRCKTSQLLADLYANKAHWIESTATYAIALQAAEDLYQSALLKSSQASELVGTNDLYRRAAYAYAKVGNLTKAIATIEQGRARGLSETLQRDRADLETIRQINPDLAERYQTAANAINQLESTERRLNITSESPQYSQEDFRQQAIQSRQALQKCLTEIRQIPDYEEFLALPTFEDVAATIQPDHPLVYLLATPNGSLALILTTVGISDLWLNDLTEPQLINLLNDNWFSAYRDSQTNRQGWREAIDDVTHQFWDWMMSPLINHLQQNNLSKAILIPTGYLSYLPLHAAWTPDITQPSGRRYACDDIQFTYVPNALSLKAARTVANQTSADTLLAINEPQPVNAGHLTSSSAEAAKAISTFPDKGNWKLLQQENATRKAVLEQLPQKNVVHFSCHGFADFQSPLNSGLLMANNEILSLRDLLDLKLQNLRLAILSACETGIPGTKLPDEVISLPTGLLQAGAAGVVSSLWSVADLSTMVLLSRFYDLWRTENLDPPEALQQAHIWLRDSDGLALAPYLESSHPDLAKKLAQAPEQCPFAHPFYWAAFTYMGV